MKLNLNLARHINNDREGLYMYFNRKEKLKRYSPPDKQQQIKMDESKDKVLINFDSVFKGNFCSHISTLNEQKGGSWGTKLPPTQRSGL